MLQRTLLNFYRSVRGNAPSKAHITLASSAKRVVAEAARCVSRLLAGIARRLQCAIAFLHTGSVRIFVIAEGGHNDALIVEFELSGKEKRKL